MNKLFTFVDHVSKQTYVAVGQFRSGRQSKVAHLMEVACAFGIALALTVEGHFALAMPTWVIGLALCDAGLFGPKRD